MNTKSLFCAAILCAGLLGGCAYPAYTTAAVVGPPPAQAEVIAASPGPGYYWVGGHWAWRYGRNVWVRGHWVPRAGSAWINGHYENRSGTYVWIDGYWR